jgi:hypothetical protein
MAACFSGLKAVPSTQEGPMLAATEPLAALSYSIQGFVSSLMPAQYAGRGADL